MTKSSDVNYIAVMQDIQTVTSELISYYGCCYSIPFPLWCFRSQLGFVVHYVLLRFGIFLSLPVFVSMYYIVLEGIHCENNYIIILESTNSNCISCIFSCKKTPEHFLFE